MILKLVLLACVAALTAGKRLPRLAGGKDAKPGQFPYQINLYHKFSLGTNDPIAFGGGAILNERWILTAAYNLPKDKNGIVVKAGNIYLDKPLESEQISNVAAMFSHPKYSDVFGVYDIGLIKLESPLKFNDFVQPIDLPQLNSHPSGSGVLTGLGFAPYMDDFIDPQILQTVTLPIISNDECQNLIDAVFDSSSEEIGLLDNDLAFCTGPTDMNIGYCLHDTGNPLVIEENGKKVVAGVASFGFAFDCTQPNLPSIYTRVSAFNNWIQKTINEN